MNCRKDIFWVVDCSQTPYIHPSGKKNYSIRPPEILSFQSVVMVVLDGCPTHSQLWHNNRMEIQDFWWCYIFFLISYHTSIQYVSLSSACKRKQIAGWKFAKSPQNCFHLFLNHQSWLKYLFVQTWNCTLPNLSPFKLEFQVEYQTEVGIPIWIQIQIGNPSWIVDPSGECVQQWFRLSVICLTKCTLFVQAHQVNLCTCTLKKDN